MSPKKKSEPRGPRDAVDVEIAQLEILAQRLQSEAARLVAILDYAKSMKLTTLSVKNIPTFDHGAEQVASFISAVMKASSEAAFKQPLQAQLAQLKKKRA